MNFEDDDFEASSWRRVPTEHVDSGLYGSIEAEGDAVAISVDFTFPEDTPAEPEQHNLRILDAKERRMKSRLGIEGDLFVASASASHPLNRHRAGFDDPYDLDAGPISGLGGESRAALMEAVADAEDEMWENQLSARLTKSYTERSTIEIDGDVRFGKDAPIGYRPTVPFPSFSETRASFLARAEKKRLEADQKRLATERSDAEKARLMAELASVNEGIRSAQQEVARLEQLQK